MEVSNLFVCLMGMGVTFFGLICLIVLTMIMGKIVSSSKSAAPAAKAAPAPVPAVNNNTPNRQELIAAVSAVLAEELGTDVSAIRILSFRKLS